jgi:magnesium transporter
MLEQSTIETTLERIRLALGSQRVDDAKSLLLELHPADQAEIYQRLNQDEQGLLLPSLNVADTADLFEELSDEDIMEAVEGLTNAQLADVLDEMEPDEAADLLGDLPPQQASEVLAQMEDADEVLPLMGYPDETAGGLMTTWFIALRRFTTTEQAIKFLRDINPETEVPYYLYVVDRYRRLMGVVGLRELVIARPEATMESIMDPDVIYVTVGMDQERVAEVMARYDLSIVPVVDDQNHLLGVITHDDIVDVIEDEATEDILRLGGVDVGPLVDRPYWDQGIWQVVKSRFVWLLLLFVAGTFTGGVLNHFENQLSAVITLTIFIPLLIGTGGNAGSQTIATVIRALALKEVHPRDALKVWWREARSGLFIGVLLGIIAFTGVFIWSGDYYMALLVGLTVTTICTWANSVAALVPIFTSAIGIDPTVVSGPLMTTLIDGTGLIIYFTLASLILPQL